MTTTIDAGARAWLLKTAKSNYWRVAHWYGFDDLVQDGFMCWARIVNKYETQPNRIRSRRHLMQLFKTTYTNHIHDLSKSASRGPVEVKITDAIPRSADQSLHEYGLWQFVDKNGCDAMEYERMIVEAPAVLQPLLKALLTEGPSLTLRAAYRVNRQGQRETLNQRLCKLIGAAPDRFDYADALLSFLTSKPLNA